jgi:hypothetical protein
VLGVNIDTIGILNKVIEYFNIENDYENESEENKLILLEKINLFKSEMKNLKDYNILKKYYVEEVILKSFFKISSERYNISMIDIYNNNITKNKISFSGTVNFYNPANIICNFLEKKNKKNNKNLFFSQIYESIEDDIVGGAIESSIYGITTENPSLLEYSNTDTDIEK